MILNFLNADEQAINQIKISNSKLFNADLSMKICAENYLKGYK